MSKRTGKLSKRAQKEHSARVRRHDAIHAMLLAPNAALVHHLTPEAEKWRALIAAESLTLDTISLDVLRKLVGRVPRVTAASLLGTTWPAVAAKLGVDVGIATAGLRKLYTSQRVKRTVVERAEQSRQRLAELTAKRKAEADAAQQQQAARVLVDDRALAVRVDTLAIGTPFKLPDDVRIGVRGDVSRLMAIGIGSVSIRKTARLGDYIARSSMVVPLAADAEAHEIAQLVQDGAL